MATGYCIMSQVLVNVGSVLGECRFVAWLQGPGEDRDRWKEPQGLQIVGPRGLQALLCVESIGENLLTFYFKVPCCNFPLG